MIAPATLASLGYLTGTKTTDSSLIGSGSIYSNPEIFKIMLAQMINGSPSDLEILFGNNDKEEENSSDWFLGSSIFSNSNTSSPDFSSGELGLQTQTSNLISLLT